MKDKKKEMSYVNENLDPKGAISRIFEWFS